VKNSSRRFSGMGAATGKKCLHRSIPVPAILLVLAIALSIGRAADLPQYQLQFLGDGSVVAINNMNTVVGFRTSPATGVQTPLISKAGGAWTTLPSPTGASSVFPTALNDSGVIVGVATLSTGRRAIRWTPSGSGYAVELLPLLPGELASYATGINNLGQIVGARAGIVGTPFGFGWLHTDADGLVDLYARYGWFATPNDINDAGVILSGTQTFDLATATVTDVGLSGPANYNAIGGLAINNADMIVGSASLRSISLNIRSVFRYEGAAGWRFIAGSSKYTVATSINNLGDIGYGELGAGIYLSGLGDYALNDLLDPAVRAAGWAVTGSGCMLNDQRIVATFGRNPTTAQSGALLLTPLGSLAPPTAPTNLQGTAHSGTSSQPWNSIDLGWTNTSSLTRSYELERRAVGAPDWTLLVLTPPGFATSHTDTTVGVGITYDYRVRAVGLGGNSPWSNHARITAPTTPLDPTSPTVTILSPTNEATVSGTVTLTAHATDNVAVAYLEISYWNQYQGQQEILGSITNGGPLSVSWNTSSLTPAAYTVRAYAYDALGNWKQTEISVNVAAAAPSLNVSSIALSSRANGSRFTVDGLVTVKDAGNAGVSAAKVYVTWTKPKGVTAMQSATTDASGLARLSTSGGQGTYKFRITNLTNPGYTFDQANSTLSNNISILPKLNLSGGAQSMVLSWPTNADAFVLQSAPAMSAAAVWRNATQTRQVSGTNFTVTVPVTGIGQVFRLVEP